MQNDRLVRITVGANRRATVWSAQELMWSELCAKLQTPVRGAETLAEYMAMPKSKQDDLKDVGGFVAGTLQGDRRKANAVTGRDVVTLDMDNIPAGGAEALLKHINSLGFGYCAYSTRKHWRGAPRLRVLIPLNRTCTADEYEPLARKLAEFTGMEYCDPTTFEASRLMYWPSASTDSEYIYECSDRPFIDADGTLAMYKDWRDVSEWRGMTAPKLPRGGTQADPAQKSGIVGAFCRVYDVHKAIAEILPEEYTPCDTEGRYTYTHGSTTGGAVVYGDGLWLYSHHATDPAGGRLCNAFDLVRLHLFRDKDDAAKQDTPENRLPSFTAMTQFASECADVKALYCKETTAAALEKFNLAAPAASSAGIVTTQESDDDNPEWMTELERSSETGKPKKTIDNVIKILEGDPLLKRHIAYDEFSCRVLAIGPLPWDPTNTRRRAWADIDDAGLRHYIEAVYYINGKDRILDAHAIVARKHTFNAVCDYLNRLPEWDGVPRLDTLLADYLGAEDTPYSRAVSRKMLVAAIARALQPGVKYDCVPVFTGPQGKGKSTLLAVLGGEWFSDSLEKLEGKDACEGLQGMWMLELGELNVLSRTAVSAVKQFVSRRVDFFRAAYGRRAEEHPRRCVFFGTTNEAEFLKDHTGNRRFWPVDCTGVAKKNVFTELVAERDQVWAEAIFRYKEGEKLYLTGEELTAAVAAQESHAESNAKDGIVQEFASRRVPADWNSMGIAARRMFWGGEYERADKTVLVERDRICAAEIWVECFAGEVKQMRRADAMEINAALAKIPGWHRAKSNVRFAEYGAQKGFVRATLGATL